MTREVQPPRHSSPPPQSVDSDDEDPNSPSDGYFSNSSHVPQNILVPDPRNSGSQSDKSREAESSSQSPTSYRHSEPEPSIPAGNQSVTFTPPSSTHSGENLTETSPLLEEPPPMYEDAVAGRPRPEFRAQTSAGYGSTMNSNVGNTRFVPGASRIPESMADHPRNNSDIYDEESAPVEQPTYSRGGCFGRRKRRDLGAELRPKHRRSLFKRLLLFLAGFLCVLWFIGLILSRAHADPNRNDGSTVPSNPPELEPKVPNAPQKPVVTTPSAPTSSSIPSRSSKTSTLETPSISPVPLPEPGNPSSDPHNSFPPRRIQIHETSSSVTGTYPLYDLLEISTTSGSVSIHIDPKPAPENAPNTTAEIRISTQSGSINIQGVSGAGKRKPSSGWERWWNYGFNPPPEAHVTPPSNGIPSRPYKITITSGSGSISGALIHGQDTSITSTRSGSISLQLYPVYFGDDHTSSLTTVSHSGSTNIQILDTYERIKLDGLKSRHEARGSGSMNVVYPQQWEGEVDISSQGSGSIVAYGRGLDVIRDGHHHLSGAKGAGGSEAELVAHGSGSQVFVVK